MTIRFAPAAGGLAHGEGDLAAAMAAQGGRRVPASAVPAFLAQGAAVGSLRLLSEGRALAVTTGQQAGLFTGPLYAMYKALTAAALAESLSVTHGTPVVPVFWVAGDDHDFAEINHCEVSGADGHPARIVLRERAPDAPMLPAYREILGAEGRDALARLESLLPPSDFRADTLDWLTRSYAPEHSLAEACAVALAELLGPCGVVVCRGWHPALKAAAGPVILAALREAPSLDVELAAEAERLRAAGAEVPVAVGEGLSLVMLEGKAGRDRLRQAGPGRFVTRRGGEPVTTQEVERLLAAEPERISANVLLRPAVEAHVLPTVAYVGGPAEMAYLAQTGPVFALTGVPRPVRMPRVSGFLVEAKVDRVLGRLSVTPDALAGPDGEIAASLARDALPPAAVDALAALRAALTERYAVLRTEAVAIDSTLEKPVESARNQALAGAHDIEKKLLAHLRRQNDTVLQQVARAREQLFPGGKPQERVLGVASFLSRHGKAILDVIRDGARAHAKRLLEAPPGRT